MYTTTSKMQLAETSHELTNQHTHIREQETPTD